ncbi:unnamed protein product, partial [Didymodactylos carnosus]
WSENTAKNVGRFQKPDTNFSRAHYQTPLDSWWSKRQVEQLYPGVRVKIRARQQPRSNSREQSPIPFHPQAINFNFPSVSSCHSYRQINSTFQPIVNRNAEKYSLFRRTSTSVDSVTPIIGLTDEKKRIKALLKRLWIESETSAIVCNGNSSRVDEFLIWKRSLSDHSHFILASSTEKLVEKNELSKINNTKSSAQERLPIEKNIAKQQNVMIRNLYPSHDNTPYDAETDCIQASRIARIVASNNKNNSNNNCQPPQTLHIEPQTMISKETIQSITTAVPLPFCQQTIPKVDLPLQVPPVLSSNSFVANTRTKQFVKRSDTHLLSKTKVKPIDDLDTSSSKSSTTFNNTLVNSSETITSLSSSHIHHAVTTYRDSSSSESSSLHNDKTDSRTESIQSRKIVYRKTKSYCHHRSENYNNNANNDCCSDTEGYSEQNSQQKNYGKKEISWLKNDRHRYYNDFDVSLETHGKQRQQLLNTTATNTLDTEETNIAQVDLTAIRRKHAVPNSMLSPVKTNLITQTNPTCYILNNTSKDLNYNAQYSYKLDYQQQQPRQGFIRTLINMFSFFHPKVPEDNHQTSINLSMPTDTGTSRCRRRSRNNRVLEYNQTFKNELQQKAGGQIEDFNVNRDDGRESYHSRSDKIVSRAQWKRSGKVCNDVSTHSSRSGYHSDSQILKKEKLQHKQKNSYHSKTKTHQQHRGAKQSYQELISSSASCASSSSSNEKTGHRKSSNTTIRLRDSENNKTEVDQVDTTTPSVKRNIDSKLKENINDQQKESNLIHVLSPTLTLDESVTSKRNSVIQTQDALNGGLSINYISSEPFEEPWQLIRSLPADPVFYQLMGKHQLSTTETKSDEAIEVYPLPTETLSKQNIRNMEIKRDPDFERVVGSLEVLGLLLSDLNEYEYYSFKQRIDHILLHENKLYIGGSTSVASITLSNSREEVRVNASNLNIDNNVVIAIKLFLINIEHQSLIVCYSNTFGTCEERSIHNLRLLNSKSIYVVPDDIWNSSTAVIGKMFGNVSVIYVARTFTSHQFLLPSDSIPAIAARYLNQENFMEIVEKNDGLKNSRKAIVHFMYRYAQTFIINYIKGFTNIKQNYIYYLTVQKNDIKGEQIISKISRFCSNSTTIDLLRTYIEMPLVCRTDTTLYNILLAATTLNIEQTSEQIILGLFGKSKFNSTQIEKEVAICLFKVNDIDKAFNHNFKACYEHGMQNRGLGFIKPDEPCRREKENFANVNSTYCTIDDRLPFPIGGKTGVQGKILYENDTGQVAGTGIKSYLTNDGIIGVAVGWSDGSLTIGEINENERFNIIFEEKLSNNPIGSDILYDSNLKSLIIHSNHLIYLFPTDKCSTKRSCLQCMTLQNCRWCETLNSCVSPKVRCSFNFSSNCPNDVKFISPNDVLIDSDERTITYFINDDVDDLMILMSNIKCNYNFEITSMIYLSKSKIICALPTNNQQFLPPVNLSLILMPHHITLVKIDNHLFKDCSMIKNCLTCEQNECVWYINQCIGNYFKINRTRMCKDIPKFLSIFPENIPLGGGTTLQITVENINNHKNDIAVVGIFVGDDACIDIAINHTLIRCNTTLLSKIGKTNVTVASHSWILQSTVNILDPQVYYIIPSVASINSKRVQFNITGIHMNAGRFHQV